jgi:hypothetical protein
VGREHAAVGVEHHGDVDLVAVVAHRVAVDLGLAVEEHLVDALGLGRGLVEHVGGQGADVAVGDQLRGEALVGARLDAHLDVVVDVGAVADAVAAETTLEHLGAAAVELDEGFRHVFFSDFFRRACQSASFEHAGVKVRAEAHWCCGQWIFWLAAPWLLLRLLVDVGSGCPQKTI